MGDQRNTKEIPGAFDVLERLQPGEPIFPLAGRDPFGPGLVMEWARLKRAEALRMPNEAKARAELMQASEAELIAWRMEEFRRGYEPQPEAALSPYSGYRPDAAAKARQDEIDKRLADSRKLDSHLSDALEIADRAAGFGLPDAVERIERATALLREASEIIRPKRQLQAVA